MIYLSLVVTLWAFLSLASAWDRSNTDPALADSMSKATCTGPLPKFAIPKYLLPDGTDATLQKICVQTQYGGNPRGHNAGGFCQQQMRYINQEKSIVENGRYVAEIHKGLWEYRIDPYSLSGPLGPRKMNLRVSRYCKMRCICDGVPQDQRAPVKFNSPIPIDTPDAIHHLPEIIDLNNLRENTAARYSPDDLQQQLLARIWAELVPKLLGPGDANGVYEVELPEISIHYSNKIQCDSEISRISSLRLPPPARPQDYSSITDLCAVALSGGHS